MEAPSLSVVIPTINEADCLSVLLQQLQQQKNINLEVVVADGGSADATVAIAEASGAKVVNSAKGRAKQLNAGAQAAAHNTLLCLHADSDLDNDFFLSSALAHFFAKHADNNNVAGHFPLRFLRQSNKHGVAFRFLEAKSASNCQFTINGDQGLLISKHYFAALGGYDESLTVMEDQDIAARIFATGQWIVLPEVLGTSARRFEGEGFHRRYILMSLMMGLYWTDAHEFFSRAKNVYVDQNKTGKLKLWPFFVCIWQMLKDDYGGKASLMQWYKVGRYVRQNAWQLFFFFDIAFNFNTNPLTGFYRKIIHRLIDNKLCNALVGLCVFIWYSVVLAPSFYFLDVLITKRDD